MADQHSAFRPADVQSKSTVSRSIRLDDPESYEITPKMKAQFFTGFGQAPQPASSIRSMQHVVSKPQQAARDFQRQGSTVTEGEGQQQPQWQAKQHGFTETSELRFSSMSPTRQPVDSRLLQQTGRGFTSHVMREKGGYRVQQGRQVVHNQSLNTTHETKGYFGMPMRDVQRAEKSRNMIYESAPMDLSNQFDSMSHYGKQTSPSIPSYDNKLQSNINVMASSINLSDQNYTVRYPEQCKCRRTPSGECETSQRWKHFIIRRPQDLALLRNSYNSILKMPRKQEDEVQIEKDVYRTYPELDVYMPGTTSSRKLINILNAIAAYYPKLGYLQGMNFICATIIYHIEEEYLAFWVFSYLTEYLDLHELYKPGLPGLASHSARLTEQLQFRFPDLHQAFEERGIMPQLYLTEWLIPLGCYHVPLSDTGNLVRFVLEFGWEFLYNLILEVLKALRPQLLGMDDAGILETLKHYTQHGNKIDTSKDKRVKIDWFQAMVCAKAACQNSYY